MIFIFFNLLVNSVFSLVAGLLLVYFFIWFFGVATGHWKLFLLSLPFVKIVYDFARGVPEKSVLFSGVDPFTLPPKHQVLSMGAGFDGWTPYLSTIFSVHAPDGKTYNSSVGDYLLIWIHRQFGDQVPLVAVSVVIAIAMMLLGIRFVSYVRFELRRRKDRHKQQSLKVVELPLRIVDVYCTSNFSGTPFTGGIVKPYICLPEDAIAKLTSEELDAVIAHELGHVRYYDLLVTVLIQVLGDLFWFVPGYRWLSRKIDRLREIVADKSAIESGITAPFLASALLKLKEIPEAQDRFVLYSAFFREKSLLKERVGHLLGQIPEPTPRWGWQMKGLRYVVVLFIAMVVMNSVLGGNFKNEALMHAPEWIESLLKVSCLCVQQKFYAQV